MPPVRFKATRKRVSVIDAILRSEGRHTLDSLSKTLGVTVRTVCRDLAFMKQKMGLPVAHDQTQGYFYALPVAPVNLASNLAARPFAAGPATRVLSLEAVRHNLEIVHDALYKNRTLFVRLLRNDGIKIDYPIRPYFLSRMRGDLYLFAGRTDSHALLNVPVSTILRVEQGPEMDEPSPFGAEKVRSSGGWVRSGTRHTVRLRFKKHEDWASQLQICEDQKVEMSNRGLVFQFGTDDFDDVRRLVRLLGHCVRLEDPDLHLRDEAGAGATAGILLLL